MTTPLLTAARIREIAETYVEVTRRMPGDSGQWMLSGPAVGERDRSAASERRKAFVVGFAAQLEERLGEGRDGNLFVADWMRLTQIVSVLSQGTVEQALERARSQVAALSAAGVSYELIEAAKEHATAREAELLAIDPSEVEAVLGSLDALEPVFPPLVRVIRARAETALLEAADPGSSRTKLLLTRERIRRLLDLVRELAPGSEQLRESLAAIGSFRPGAAAEKPFGTEVRDELEQRGEDPDRFREDLRWVREIAANLQMGSTIAQRRAELAARRDPAAWVSRGRSPAASVRMASTMSWAMDSALARLERIDPDSEVAVPESLPDIERVLGAFWPRPQKPGGA